MPSGIILIFTIWLTVNSKLSCRVATHGPSVRQDMEHVQKPSIAVRSTINILSTKISQLPPSTTNNKTNKNGPTRPPPKLPPNILLLNQPQPLLPPVPQIPTPQPPLLPLLLGHRRLRKLLLPSLPRRPLPSRLSRSRLRPRKLPLHPSHRWPSLSASNPRGPAL